jgi:hypothetical protein
MRYLTREGGPQDGFWIHLDADVFDETIMQAVDDPRASAIESHRAEAVPPRPLSAPHPRAAAVGPDGRYTARTMRVARTAMGCWTAVAFSCLSVGRDRGSAVSDA